MEVKKKVPVEHAGHKERVQPGASAHMHLS